MSAPSPSPSQRTTPTPSATPDPVAGWVELTVTAGPPAREDHTWTVDDSGASAYLFGGRDGAVVLDDLWAYDLATDVWRRLEPAGDRPPGRFGHNAVWSDEHGLVLFAGQAGPSTFFNDLWAYDPEADTWRALSASGEVPISRYGSCAALDAAGALWISHGFTSDGTRFDDTRRYDFDSGAWTDATPAGRLPIARCLHACWFTDDGALTLYAGQTTGVQALGDRWTLTSGESWAADDGELPAPRNLPATARWAGGTVVFGGQGADGAFLDDAWQLIDDGAAAAIDARGPAGRAGAELVADPERGRLLLFAGMDAAGSRADLWELALP